MQCSPAKCTINRVSLYLLWTALKKLMLRYPRIPPRALWFRLLPLTQEEAVATRRHTPQTFELCCLEGSNKEWCICEFIRKMSCRESGMLHKKTYYRPHSSIVLSLNNTLSASKLWNHSPLSSVTIIYSEAVRLQVNGSGTTRSAKLSPGRNRHRGHYSAPGEPHWSRARK